MAFPRSARFSTISTTKDCRAGMSKALISPCATLSHIISSMVMMPRKRQYSQSERLQHRKYLGDHQDPVAIPAVDPHSSERRQRERWNLSGKAHDAQQERGTGQPVDQPAGGDARHPGADQRDGLSAEEQPVVAIGERPHRELPCAGLIRAGRFGDGLWVLSFTRQGPGAPAMVPEAQLKLDELRFQSLSWVEPGDFRGAKRLRSFDPGNPWIVIRNEIVKECVLTHLQIAILRSRGGGPRWLACRLVGKLGTARRGNRR